MQPCLPHLRQAGEPLFRAYKPNLRVSGLGCLYERDLEIVAVRLTSCCSSIWGTGSLDIYDVGCLMVMPLSVKM